MRVVITGPAEAELAAIADYIAEDNPERAASFVVELVDRCLGLADMPNAFPMVERQEQAGVRRRVYKAYAIFYRVRGEVLEILHVLHGAQDYERLLEQE